MPLGPVHFRYFHLAHHRFTHDPQSDPELATPKPVTRWQYAVYLTGLPESASRVKTLLSTAVVPNTDPFVPARGRAKIRREARIMLALYVVAFGLLPQTLLWGWLVPYAAGAPFLRAYLLAEHAFCPNVANMLENTRTTFTARLVRWIAWNMPYHTEHHADPAVPFHQLPAFHRILKPHLINTEQGYTRFAISYVERSGKAQTDASQPSLQNR